MSYNQSKPHCLHCQRRPEDGARFFARADTKKLDELCVDCRFEVIDGKHADSAAIRADMRAVGVPVARAGRKLRFEPGADACGSRPDEEGDE